MSRYSAQVKGDSRAMKKILIMIMALIMLISISACSADDDAEVPAEEPAAEETESQENTEMKKITMRINDEEVRVIWENNESVKALAELAASPLTINTSQYGGFEQVGSIGTTLPSNDKNIKTKAGDIVLYTSDSIVVFYGSNSWAYTKLGHIEGKNKDELRDLLSGNNVVITITAE